MGKMEKHLSAQKAKGRDCEGSEKKGRMKAKKRG